MVPGREERIYIYICITYGVCDIGTCIFSRGPRYSARNAAEEVEREKIRHEGTEGQGRTREINFKVGGVIGAD